MSPHLLSEQDISWGELILVMEEDQKSRILDSSRHPHLPRIASLDIPDRHEFMDRELIAMIRTSIEGHSRGLEDRARPS